MPTSEVDVDSVDMEGVVEEDNTPKKMSFKELKDYDGQLWAQNMGPTKFTCRQKTGKFEVDFELGPNGSDEESDTDLMPKECLDVAGFRRAMAKGIIAVSADEEMDDRIEVNIAASVEADTKRRNALMAQTEEPLNRKDLITAECVVCHTMTFQPMREVTIGVPPTCPLHKKEADNYQGTQTGVTPEGRAIWVYVRRPGV